MAILYTVWLPVAFLEHDAQAVMAGK